MPYFRVDKSDGSREEIELEKVAEYFSEYLQEDGPKVFAQVWSAFHENGRWNFNFSILEYVPEPAEVWVAYTCQEYVPRKYFEVQVYNTLDDLQYGNENVRIMSEPDFDFMNRHNTLDVQNGDVIAVLQRVVS